MAKREVILPEAVINFAPYSEPMFFKHDKDYIDLSMEVSDAADWQAGTLRTVFHHLDIVAFGIESVSGLLAVGISDSSRLVKTYLKIPIHMQVLPGGL